MGASRGNPVGGGFEDFEQEAFETPLAPATQSNPHPLAREGPAGEDHPARVAQHGPASVSEVLYAPLDGFPRAGRRSRLRVAASVLGFSRHVAMVEHPG